MIKFIDNLESRFNLARTTIIIAVLTLLSRLFGFVRDLILASNLGLSEYADIYFTSFRIPDLIYNLLILGTLSAAFIPVFTNYWVKDKNEARELMSSVFNIAVLAIFSLSAIAFLLARPLTNLVAPGFTEEAINQTVVITRILLLSPILFTASSVISSTLISLKKFIWVNTAPLFYNAGIIIGLIWLYPIWGLKGLAAGVILGALMHLLVQAPQLYRLGFRWRPIINYHHRGVKKIIKLFIPRIFGLDISYINLIIVSIVGSTITTGSIAAFNYASNIQSVPIGIFALSTTLAIFPVLSENFANKDIHKFINNFKTAFVRILYFVMPFSVLMLLLRAHIVRILLGYGECDWTCTITTFDTLGVLTLSLVAQSLISLLARAFYARQNTKTPVIISVIAMILNAGLSYTLSLGLGITGVALGFVIASIFQFALLSIYFHKELKSEKELSEKTINELDFYLIKTSTKIVFAATIMGFISYISLYIVAPILNTRTVFGIVTQAGFACIVAVVVYLYTTSTLKVPDAIKIRSALNKTMKFFNVSGIEQNS